MGHLLLVLVLLLSTLVAQQQTPLSFSVLPDGTLVAAVYDEDIGQILVSYATQGPAAQASFRTTWTDVGGVTHEVSTPVVGGGQNGATNALKLHKMMVGLAQTEWPPRPVSSGGSGGCFSDHQLIEELGELGFIWPQGPNGQNGPQPVSISSRWITADGLGHMVTTPIENTSEAGIAAALAVHKLVVRLAKEQFPPQVQ